MLFALLDSWLAPAPAARRVDWLGRQAYAHRGLHRPGLPENSLGAFRAAVERGMGIECDVQRSADDQAMVFHDFELDRLTAESGLVQERSSAELAAIPLRGSGERIASLRRMLEEVAGRAPVLVEIKSRRGPFRPAATLSQAVHRVLEGYTGPHAIMSFDPRVVRWFAVHAPLTPRGLVVTEEHDRTLRGILRRHLFLWRARPEFLAYDVRDLPSRFAAAQRRRGLPLLTWTVRSPELLRRAALHADAPIAEGGGIA